MRLRKTVAERFVENMEKQTLPSASIGPRYPGCSQRVRMLHGGGVTISTGCGAEIDLDRDSAVKLAKFMRDNWL